MSGIPNASHIGVESAGGDAAPKEAIAARMQALHRAFSERLLIRVSNIAHKTSEAVLLCPPT